MKIRLTKNDRIVQTYAVTERDDKGRAVKQEQVIKKKVRYRIEREKVKKTIFGNVKDTRWVCIMASDDKEEMEEAFDWMVENNTIGTVTKILNQNKINNE